MVFKNISYSGLSAAMVDFKIQGSNNNETWNDIKTITGNTKINPGDRHLYTFNEVSYRYYRILITNGVNWSGGNKFWGMRYWKLLYIN